MRNRERAEAFVDGRTPLNGREGDINELVRLLDEAEARGAQGRAREWWELVAAIRRHFQAEDAYLAGGDPDPDGCLAIEASDAERSIRDLIARIEKGTET